VATLYQNRTRKPRSSRIAQEALGELQALVARGVAGERADVMGALLLARLDDFQKALEELQTRRGSQTADAIVQRYPDGVRLSVLTRELGLKPTEMSDLVVDLGIGRWEQNAHNSRVVFNATEDEYVYSAAFNPGLLTPKGAEAIRRFVRTGERPVLKGQRT